MVCPCFQNAVPYIPSWRVRCLFLAPANRIIVQERITPKLADVGTSVLKRIADQKKMVHGWRCADAVSVWRCTPTDTARCRSGRVPKPMRWYCHPCRCRSHTIGWVRCLPWTRLRLPLSAVTCTKGCYLVAWRVCTPDFADSLLFWFCFASCIVIMYIPTDLMMVDKAMIWWTYGLTHWFISIYHLIIYSSNHSRKEKFIVYGVGHGLSVLFSPFISEILLMNVWWECKYLYFNIFIYLFIISSK